MFAQTLERFFAKILEIIWKPANIFWNSINPIDESKHKIFKITNPSD